MKRDPKENADALRRIAADRAGYFTAGEALSAGYSYPQQHFHRERGNWTWVDHGLFRLPEYPATSYEDFVRWTLWTRSRRGVVRGIVSHDSALAVHELCEIDPIAIHLTVPRNFRPRPPKGCRLHRGSVPAGDIEQRHGFRVTSPRRTLIDAANSMLSPEILETAVTTAIDRGLITHQELGRAKLTISGRKRLDAVLAATST